MTEYSVHLADWGHTGRRHVRLKRIWSALSVLWQGKARVDVLDNPQGVWTHSECLQQHWARARYFHRHGKMRYAIFTEFDFLPDGEGFFQKPEGKPILAAAYAWGVGGHPQRKTYPFPGAWYIVADMERVEGDPDFSPAGPFNDPACGIEADLMPVYFAYPRHCGAECEAGVHLFWYRHLHDPQESVVGAEEMPLGEMQVLHDLAVTKWLEDAPREFHRIYDAADVYDPPRHPRSD